jgi:hypothetical protein
VPQAPDTTPSPSGDAATEDERSDTIDARLKRLGDAFLDEEVPDALLEVLRRAAAARSKADGQSDGSGRAPAGDEHQDSEATKGQR